MARAESYPVLTVAEDADDIIYSIEMRTSSGQPDNGVPYNSPQLEAAYKIDGDPLGWIELAPFALGTLGTYLEKGWVEDTGFTPQVGWYELGIPNAAKAAGKRTLWRVATGNGEYHFFAIDYTIQAGGAGGTTPPPSEVVFRITVPGSEVFFDANSATIYIKETGVQVDFVANQDITSELLKIVFENDDKTDFYIFTDAEITKNGNVATVTLPAIFTDNTISLNWAVRNETTLRVYGRGSLGVQYAPHED